VIRTRSHPGFDSSRSRSRRRGPRLLPVLGWIAVLGGAVYFGAPRYFARELPPPLPDEPPTLPIPVTDVAEADARQRIIAFRDATRYWLGEGEALFDSCSERSADEVRVAWADDAGAAYGDGAGPWPFLLAMKATVDGAHARWHSFGRMGGLPPAEPLDRTRELTAAAWSALRARVLSPGFLRLRTVDSRGIERPFEVTIESCTAGHYHFVSRWSPRPPVDREFLGVADAILAAGGNVLDYPRTIVVEPTAPSVGDDDR
jgi:hypothetical protein